MVRASGPCELLNLSEIYQNSIFYYVELEPGVIVIILFYYNKVHKVLSYPYCFIMPSFQDFSSQNK